MFLVLGFYGAPALMRPTLGRSDARKVEGSHGDAIGDTSSSPILLVCCLLNIGGGGQTTHKADAPQMSATKRAESQRPRWLKRTKTQRPRDLSITNREMCDKKS